ncbi:hypothetical protein [Methylobacterium sp. J-077]|uniref:hypothetical protein n=1 Tax=Methylobacterium sp. J-077 TaxID=2836656 RepID=UPI001FBB7D54|nr:hypothetical protein [Methylobacterium sp. J-077]MCJ2122406.1 hypothetical protein [Methylobacterium sp. J-077]
MNQDEISDIEKIPKTRPIGSETTIDLPELNLDSCIGLLAQAIKDRAEVGWSVGSVTLTPTAASRDRRRIPDVVRDPVLKVHFRLSIFANRGPHPANRKRRNVLPLLIGAADLPNASENPDEVNSDPGEGLRYRGLLAMPPGPLGNLPMRQHVMRLDEFIREGTGVERVDFEAVDPTTISDAMWSCFETVCRGSLKFEEALVALPRAWRAPVS